MSFSNPTTIARLYDATHEGVEGDLDHYRAECPPEATVLELATGTGRILQALIGRDTLVGIDIDEDRLAIARERCGDDAELICADMQSFRDDRRFDRILLVFNGLYCLPDREALRQTFDTVARHLHPGGRFLCDVYDTAPLDQDALEVGPGPHRDPAEKIGDLTLDDRTFEVFEENHWFPSERRLEAYFTYVSGPVAEPLVLQVTHHYHRLDEIIAVAREKGLDLIDHRRGFTDDDPDGPHLLTFTAALISK